MTENIYVVLPDYVLAELDKTRLEAVLPDANYRYAALGKDTASDCEWATIVIGLPKASNLARATNLKWLQTSTAGVNWYLGEKYPLPPSVRLSNARGAYGAPVAEYMVAMTMALSKNLLLYRDAQRQGVWKRIDSIKLLANCTVLSLGMGDIAKAYCSVMRALGCKIIGLRRTKSIVAPEWCDHEITYTELDATLPQADIIAISLPDTAETRGLVNADFLAKLKPGALLINGGRGNTVVTEDLVTALQSGHLGGAGLDVVDPEPLAPNHPLWQFDNVCITPHIAGDYNFPGAFDRILDIIIENLHHYKNGEPFSHEIKRELGY